MLEVERAIHIQIEELPEGLLLATSGGLLGLVTQGRTFAQAPEIARDVARKLIEARHERGGVSFPAAWEHRDACGFVFDRQAAGSHESRGAF